MQTRLGARRRCHRAHDGGCDERCVLTWVRPSSLSLVKEDVITMPGGRSSLSRFVGVRERRSGDISIRQKILPSCKEAFSILFLLLSLLARARSILWTRLRLEENRKSSKKSAHRRGEIKTVTPRRNKEIHLETGTPFPRNEETRASR